MNKFSYKALIAFFLILKTTNVLSAEPCLSVPVDPSSGGVCTTTPNLYKVYIYKMGLCNNIDGTSVATATNYLNNCVTTFDAGSNPAEVFVRNNVSDPVTNGSITKPPNGSYTHGYVLIKGQVDIKSSVQFTSAVTAGGGSGNVCWTEGGGGFGSAKCGATIDNSAYGFNTTLFQNLEGSGDCPFGSVAFHCNYNSAADIASRLDPTHAFLLDSLGNLSTNPNFSNTPGDVQYMLGIATFINQVVVDDNSSAMVLEFKVTRGLTVDYRNPSSIGLYLSEFKTVTKIE